MPFKASSIMTFYFQKHKKLCFKKVTKVCVMHCQTFPIFKESFTYYSNGQMQMMRGKMDDYLECKNKSPLMTKKSTHSKSF